MAWKLDYRSHRGEPKSTRPRHSLAGITSTVIGIAGWVLASAVFTFRLAGFGEIAFGAAILSVCYGPLVSLIGIAFGLAGPEEPTVRRVFNRWGLGLNFALLMAQLLVWTLALGN